jgi:hypothetical protein
MFHVKHWRGRIRRAFNRLAPAFDQQRISARPHKSRLDVACMTHIGARFMSPFLSHAGVFHVRFVSRDVRFKMHAQR